MSSLAPAPSGSDPASAQEPWAKAFATLAPEDQAQFSDAGNDMLGTLKGVQLATESKKKLCIEKGWKVYRNKNGDDIKLRHVLEKISVWVTEMIKVVDVGVSFDKSGQAALPWGIVKFIITVGINDVNVFSNIVENVESVSALIARYTIIEKLYLHEDSDATLQLRESITKLYAAILLYLAKAKAYFSGNSIKRIKQGLLDMLSKQYDEMWEKISEVEVNKWIKMVDAELQRKMARAAAERHETLKNILQELDQPIMQIADQVTALTDRFNRAERKEVFHWMSTIDYRNHHEEFSRDMLDGTGNWLFTSKEYIQWGQSSMPSILWLHGKPGSGKTRLTSKVIGRLLEKSASVTVSPVAFFYIARDSAEPERSDPDKIMGALLRQLASSKPDLPIKEPVAKEYERRKEKAEDDCSNIRELSIEDCTRLILELTRDNPATIVIDALDECQETHKLLRCLDRIVSESEELVKVFISSREDVDIRLHLRNFPVIAISATKNGDDIARFVQTEVERLSSERLLLDGKIKKSLKDKTVKKLTDGAQGMFRWVALSLQTLQRIKHPRDFKEALGQLPSKLSDLYDIIFKQINNTETHGRNVAVMTLKWLLSAQRLLSVRELIVAVSVDSGTDTESSSDSDSDKDNTDEERSSSEHGSDDVYSMSGFDIVQFCRNLVVIDLELDVFRLAHHSVREYLEHREDFSPSQANMLALERCLEINTLMAEMIPEQKQNATKNSIFQTYATLYWPLHYRNISNNELAEQVQAKLLEFLFQDHQPSPSFIEWSLAASKLSESLAWTDSLRVQLAEILSSPPSPQFLACSFGLDSLINTIDSHTIADWNLRNDGYRTGFHVAAELGHVKIIKLLLANPAVVADSSDRWGRTPLCSAAINGHEAVIKMLLATKDVDPGSRDGDGRTPLSYAAAHGHEAAVNLFLAVDSVDPNNQDILGLTPLSHAVINEHEAIITLLLARNDVDPNSPGKIGRTPLSYAAKSSSEEAVKLLLSRHDVNPNFRDIYGRPPLSYAVEAGNEAVVKSLLAIDGIELDYRDIFGRTPVSLAVQGAHQKIVELLQVTSGIHPHSIDDVRQVDFSRAIENGNEEVGRLLRPKADSGQFLGSPGDMELSDQRRKLRDIHSDGHSAAEDAVVLVPERHLANIADIDSQNEGENSKCLARADALEVSSKAADGAPWWYDGEFFREGPFGNVYIASKSDDSCPIAVKEICVREPQLVAKFAQKFLDEMNVLDVMSHLNMISYQGIEVHRDKVGILMEYCAGGSLADILIDGPIEDEQTIKIYALEILTGLAFLHRAGMIHGNLKPENILFDTNGILKLVDFGTAKLIARQDETVTPLGDLSPSHHQSATTPGSSQEPNQEHELGTATESVTCTSQRSICTDPARAIHRQVGSDIWSLGCLIVQMVDGLWPASENERTNMYNTSEEIPPQLPAQYELSESGIDFLQRCFESGSTRRPDAIELLEHQWILQIRHKLDEGC